MNRKILLLLLSVFVLLSIIFTVFYINRDIKSLQYRFYRNGSTYLKMKYKENKKSFLFEANSIGVIGGEAEYIDDNHAVFKGDSAKPEVSYNLEFVFDGDLLHVLKGNSKIADFDLVLSLDGRKIDINDSCSSYVNKNKCTVIAFDPDTTVRVPENTYIEYSNERRIIGNTDMTIIKNGNICKKIGSTTQSIKNEFGSYPLQGNKSYNYFTDNGYLISFIFFYGRVCKTIKYDLFSGERAVLE